MAEAVIRQRLIRLSCDKLLKAKRTSGGLGRCLQVLTVLKQAHNDKARFEPECSDLIRPKPERLVVIIEQAPIQRISNDERIVPFTSICEQSEVAVDEQDPEEDGGSMARKRKNHSHADTATHEKRHCDKKSTSSSRAAASSSSAPSPSQKSSSKATTTKGSGKNFK